MSSSEEPFVNRRGHSVKETDLEKSVTEAVASQAPSPIKRRRRRAYPWKKIIVAALLVFVVLPVSLGEYVRFNYTKEVGDAKSSLRQLVDTVIIPSQQSDKLTSKDMATATQKVNNILGGLCAGGLTDNIAGLYPRSVEAFKSCNDFRSSVSKLASSFKELEQELQYAEVLSVIIRGVEQADDGQFAVLAAQQDNWRNFTKNLDALAVPESFVSSHKALRDAAQAILTDWVDLVQATNEQNSSKFSAAEGKLHTDYPAFRASANSFAVAIKAAQQAVSTAWHDIK